MKDFDLLPPCEPVQLEKVASPLGESGSAVNGYAHSSIRPIRQAHSKFRCVVDEQAEFTLLRMVADNV